MDPVEGATLVLAGVTVISTYFSLRERRVAAHTERLNALYALVGEWQMNAALIVDNADMLNAMQPFAHDSVPAALPYLPTLPPLVADAVKAALQIVTLRNSTLALFPLKASDISGVRDAAITLHNEQAGEFKRLLEEGAKGLEHYLKEEKRKFII